MIYLIASYTLLSAFLSTHQERSNVELSEALEEGPDPDFKLALIENKLAIETKKAKIEHLNSLLASKQLLAPCSKSIFRDSDEKNGVLTQLRVLSNSSSHNTTVDTPSTNAAELPNFDSRDGIDL